ncbi:hypothetical protein [Occallatibacter savannae]|uniref:hypothetical protein n=1 Tax=Occallatibacter savannae TaxID=1002691 RepID=UPI000D68F34E|nr:hypothetical protein [Occallatibacter savannae]
MQSQRRPGPASSKPQAADPAVSEARMREILKEVQLLLESYAPAWYTEALSKKIEAALKK